jgi:hypothetical protein
MSEDKIKITCELLTKFHHENFKSEFQVMILGGAVREYLSPTMLYTYTTDDVDLVFPTFELYDQFYSWIRSMSQIEILSYNREGIIIAPISDNNFDLGAKFTFGGLDFDIWSADAHLPLRGQLLPFIRSSDSFERTKELSLERLRRVRGSVFLKSDDVSIILSCQKDRIHSIFEGRGWSETCHTRRIEPMSKYFIKYPSLEKQLVKIFNLTKKSTHFSDPNQKLEVDPDFLAQLYSSCDSDVLEQSLLNKGLDPLEFEAFVSSHIERIKTP